MISLALLVLAHYRLMESAPRNRAQNTILYTYIYIVCMERFGHPLDQTDRYNTELYYCIYMHPEEKMRYNNVISRHVFILLYL